MEIWTEKYRPTRVQEIVGQSLITKRLESFISQGNIPHMLFAGPPGCGKTTAAIAIANELFKEYKTSNFLELNASDERGIDVIRNKIKNFARIKPISTPYKIVCLDEADSLTGDAQHALRRTMEKYTKSTRFILVCNYSNKIIEPIQSRCAIFRFKLLDPAHSIEQLKKIAVSENLDIEQDVFPEILKLSNGDMRKAINILQTSSIGEKITKQTIYDINHLINPDSVNQMIDKAISKNFSGARQDLINLLKNGSSAEDIIRSIGELIHDLDIPEQEKLFLIDRIGEFEWRLARGGHPQIQLEALLSQFALRKQN